MMQQPRRLGLLIGFLVLVGGLLVGLVAAWLIVRPSPEHTTVEAVVEQAKTVVAVGDISCEPGAQTNPFDCQTAQTAALISTINPDAILLPGDLQYPSGSLAAFQDAYDKTWGAYKDKSYPAPGNHEYATPGAAGYFDYFGERVGERGKGYYRFTVGDWNIFALNSEIDTSANSEQLTWLKTELAKDPTTCTLAYWHKPRFSTGGHPDDPTYDALWRVLYDNDVDVVINGHSHAYERFVPQNPDGQHDAERGITEFVSGMGGRSVEALHSPVSTLANRQNHSFGVLKLSLYRSKADYEFVPVDTAQTFTDRGSVACH